MIYLFIHSSQESNFYFYEMSTRMEKLDIPETAA